MTPSDTAYHHHSESSAKERLVIAYHHTKTIPPRPFRLPCLLMVPWKGQIASATEISMSQLCVLNCLSNLFFQGQLMRHCVARQLSITQSSVKL